MSSLLISFSFIAAVAAAGPAPAPHVSPVPMDGGKPMAAKPYKKSGAVAVYKEADKEGRTTFTVTYTDQAKTLWVSQPVVFGPSDCGAGSCTDTTVSAVTIQKAKNDVVWIRFMVKQDHYLNEAPKKHEIKLHEAVLGCRLGQPDRGTPTPACALVDGDWQGKVKIKDSVVNGTVVDF